MAPAAFLPMRNILAELGTNAGSSQKGRPPQRGHLGAGLDIKSPHNAPVALSIPSPGRGTLGIVKGDMMARKMCFERTVQVVSTAPVA